MLRQWYHMTLIASLLQGFNGYKKLLMSTSLQSISVLGRLRSIADKRRGFAVERSFGFHIPSATK